MNTQPNAAYQPLGPHTTQDQARRLHRTVTVLETGVGHYATRVETLEHEIEELHRLIHEHRFRAQAALQEIAEAIHQANVPVAGRYDRAIERLDTAAGHLQKGLGE